MKDEIVKLLALELKQTKEDIESSLEIPPSLDLGDFAFPCFKLASVFKKAPMQIALDLATKLENKKPKNLEKIEARGPYVNFFISNKIGVVKVIEDILKEKAKYGSSNEGKGKILTIDMSSPNIAKPFGIGHLRSTIIGNSISELFKKSGYKVVKINYLGDWGTQFGKMIFGWKKWGNAAKLKKDSIKHMFEIYVRANEKQYEAESREWFKRLEDGDRGALKLWKMFRELSLKDFDKIYKTLGVKFDVISGESFYNDKMQDTIKELEKKSLLIKDEGALIVDLNKYGLGVCLIQKSDGATLYATRDLTAAIDRHKKYKFSEMIYEVGQEQRLHFQQVFKVLELMGHTWAKNCQHVYHGLYLDKDGKKFATRKGKTVFMQDILNETIDLAIKTIHKKNPKLKNKEEIARKIAIGAIFYGDLKTNRASDMVFDIDRFLDFEGNTGPYLQYSYARASSIIKKSKLKLTNPKIGELNEHELKLVKKLGEFPEKVLEAKEHLNPSIIATYSYELSQMFNEFYHSSPVIGSKEQGQRIAIVEAFKIVLKSSLALLGIEVMEEM